MKISHLQQKQKNLRLRGKALAQKDGDLSDDDKNELASIKAQIKELDDRIESLKDFEEDEAKSAEPVDDVDEAEMSLSKSYTGGKKARVTDVLNDVRKTPEYEQKGYKFARFAMGKVLLAKQFGGDIQKTAQFIENRFNDSMTAKALVSNVTASGGAFVPQDYYAEMIELLRSRVVVREAGAMVIQSSQANLTMPRMASGSQATYSQEAAPINTSNASFDVVQFGVKKLTNITVVSNDLIRRAAVGVEQIVRDDLLEGIARREDIAFLTGDGSVGDPIGFANLVLPGNVIADTATVLPTTGNADVLGFVVNLLNDMQLILEVGNSRMLKPVWIASPAVKRFLLTLRDGVGYYFFQELREKGTIDGIPVLTTNQLPTNLATTSGSGKGSKLFLIDMADVIITDSFAPTIELSGEASVSINGSQVNLFQNDLSALRIIQEHDLQLRHLQSLAVANLDGWFPGNYTGVAGAPYSTQPANLIGSNAPSAVIK